MHQSRDLEDLTNEENKSEATIIKECEEALTIEDEEGYEDEIRLMSGLIDSDKKRFQKLLAVLDSHTSPVNCVRWNPLGTLFISCSDDGNIILWEYVGEMNVQGGL
jgi:WD40 repeat protein